MRQGGFTIVTAGLLLLTLSFGAQVVPQKPSLITTTGTANEKECSRQSVSRERLAEKFTESCQKDVVRTRVKLYEGQGWSLGNDAKKRASAADVGQAALIGEFDFTQRLSGEFELAYRPKGKSKKNTWRLVRFTAADGLQKMFEQEGMRKTEEMTPSEYTTRCLLINPWGKNETLRPQSLWSCGLLDPLRTSWLGKNPEEASAAREWRSVIEKGDLEGRRTAPLSGRDGYVASKWVEGSEQLTRIFLDPESGRVVEAHKIGLVANVPGLTVMMAWTFELKN